MSTRRFHLALVVTLAGLIGGQARIEAQPAAQPARRPNIVLIVADDLGYADLGCQGCKDIPTPRIDSLAAGGVRCTSGYVSCPVCSPTRAGLMTGRYQQRFGHEFNPGPVQRGNVTFGLPLDQKTMADYLKSAGYVTGMVGKWHLGFEEAYLPPRRGFAEFFGFPGGAHSYVDADIAPNNPILRGTQKVDEQEYLTDAFTREALAFIDRHAKEPFFLYLPYNAVHTPLQAPDKYLDRFKSIADEKRRKHAAMVSALDDGVGAVLDKLRAEGLEENTLVFFISDNGGPTAATTASNAPLSGFKGQVLEGGIRVPYILQWKGRLPAGKTYDRPVISLDILPTALAVAGADRPANLDGVDILPYVAGKKDNAPHEALYWRFGQASAIRRGDWKLLRQPGQAPKLFDLAKDIGEKNDLAAANPDKVKDLEAELDRWNGELKEPLWKRAARATNRANRAARRNRPTP